jgi:hypothetical protein
MARPRYALILLFIVAFCRAALGQSPLAPEAGILVLRNGQVLGGEVTRAGDYYVVTKGEGSELRLKADEVELFCGSLLEAYDFKARHISSVSAKPYLELAKWCLRQQMHDQCADQIAAASRVEPTNPQIKELETRLKLAVESQPPPSSASPVARGVTADELEKTLRDMPRGSVEKFGAIVQPILLNRCGANQCHGPNAKSEFRLLRPPPGQIVSRRFTQRNLHAALRYVNPAQAEESPLVVMPQQRHGNSLSAVFDKHTEGQLSELVAWVKMTVSPGRTAAPPVPATISPVAMALSQPAAASGVPSPAATPANDPIGVRVMRPTLDNSDSSAVSTPPSSPGQLQSRPAAPRDRYDPAPFNRHYHGQ